MSKYIIELDDRIKLVTSVGVTENGVVYTTSDYVHNLEELNSDYINEHYGELQDEAYQRGFEDGKWKAEDGCDGCKYYEDTSLTNPCSECSRGHVDHYKPASDPDPVKVGDKVIVPSDSHVEPGKILSIVNGVCYIMWEDKTVSAYRIDGVRCVK